MSRVYNVYCDEFCHLENDNQKVMVLGAVWSPRKKPVITAFHVDRKSRRENLESKYLKKEA